MHCSMENSLKDILLNRANDLIKIQNIIFKNDEKENLKILLNQADELEDSISFFLLKACETQPKRRSEFVEILKYLKNGKNSILWKTKNPLIHLEALICGILTENEIELIYSKDDFSLLQESGDSSLPCLPYFNLSYFLPEIDQFHLQTFLQSQFFACRDIPISNFFINYISSSYNF